METLVAIIAKVLGDYPVTESTCGIWRTGVVTIIYERDAPKHSWYLMKPETIRFLPAKRWDAV